MFGTVRFYIELGLVVALLGAIGVGYTMYYKMHSAQLEKQLVEKELTKVVDVNKQNTKAIAEMKRKAEEDRKATEKEIADTQQRASAIEAIKKEMDDVKGANDPAGAYWDTLGERLRQSRRNH